LSSRLSKEQVVRRVVRDDEERVLARADDEDREARRTSGFGQNRAPAPTAAARISDVVQDRRKAGAPRGLRRVQVLDRARAASGERRLYGSHP
jgi:hypothetical protein